MRKMNLKMILLLLSVSLLQSSYQVEGGQVAPVPPPKMIGGPPVLMPGPRCAKESTLVDVLILSESGHPAPNTKLWYHTVLGVKEAWTDNAGKVNLVITGCHVTISAAFKGQNTEERKIDLRHFNKRLQRLVVKLGEACNFVVYIQGVYRGVKSAPDLISFMATSGDKTTSGSVLAGEVTVPVCVTVEAEEDLHMVLFNKRCGTQTTLYLEEVVEGGEAVVNQPPVAGNVLTHGVRWPARPDSLTVTANIWPYAVGTDGVDNGQIAGDAIPTVVKLLLPNPLVLAGPHFAVYSFGAEEAQMYLVAIRPVTTASNIKGNALVYDRKGNQEILTFPGATYIPGHWWVLGCILGDIKSMEETNELMSEYELKVILSSTEKMEEYCGYG